MAVRGKKTPREIEEYILQQADPELELSYGAIAERVEAEFHYDVDKTTVGRIINRGGAKLLVRRKEGQPAEDPSSAVGEHWPSLRDQARSIGAQLEEGVPLPQLLGFPWRYSDYNTGLIFADGKSLSLKSESHILHTCLQEHLPTDSVWQELVQWKTDVGRLQDYLAEVTRQTSMDSGHDEVPITHDDVYSGKTGVVEFYEKSLVLINIEGSLGLDGARHDYDIRPPDGRHKWVLEWHRNSSSYVFLAASDDKNVVTDLRDSHSGAVQALAGSEVWEPVGSKYAKAEESRGRAMAAAIRISHLVSFPGKCSLYAD